MKIVRTLPRLGVLLIVAAVFVGLTAIYGNGTHPDLPSARWVAVERHPRSAPGVGFVLDFLGYAILLAIFAWLGRMLFRLRLNPAPRNEGKPILLGLHRTQREELKPLVAPPAC